MSHRALLAAGLCLAAVTAQAADFVALRVDEPATVLRGGKPTPLAEGKAVLTGDVVSAGARGKVALQLGGSSLMTLSSLGDLQVFEAKAGSARQPALAKIKLLAGALRVDSRAARGKPGQDVRLNVGSLKARLLDADAWGANTAEGDTLCLMAGTVSVQTGGTGDERLDTAGSCLRREPDGQLSRFAAESDPVIVGAIAATRFEGMGEVVDTVMAEAAAEERAAAAPTPRPAPMVAAPRPAPVAVPPASIVSTAAPQPIVAATVPQPSAPIPGVQGGWTVVVLSLAKADVVEARAQALSAQGLPAVTRTADIKGSTWHRVVIGSFATQAEARSYAAATLAPRGIKGWPAPL